MNIAEVSTSMLIIYFVGEASEFSPAEIKAELEARRIFIGVGNEQD